MAEREHRYYASILPPDLLAVLRVDPDTAAQRKQGVEEAAFVRRRAAQVHEVDWSGTNAVVVDANRPRAEVMSDLKALVWSRL
jgi:thymidylate kinase